MSAFIHLWRTVTSDLQGLESLQQVSRAVFDAMGQAYDGLDDRMWELALEILEGDATDVEQRKHLLTGMASWTPEDRGGVRSRGKAGTEEK